jgi:hypothetical protein
MSRGKIARGIILGRVVAVDLGAARENRMRIKAEAKLSQAARGEPVEWEVERVNPDGSRVFYDPNKVLEMLSAQFLPDVVNVDFTFRNDGELTIRAPAVEFREIRSKQLFDGGLVRVMKSVPTRIKLKDAIIYPGDEQAIDARLSLECKREIAFAAGDYTVNWTVFLDNSPPARGKIDLASLLETDGRQGSADR